MEGRDVGVPGVVLEVCEARKDTREAGTAIDVVGSRSHGACTIMERRGSPQHGMRVGVGVSVCGGGERQAAVRAGISRGGGDVGHDQ